MLVNPLPSRIKRVSLFILCKCQHQSRKSQATCWHLLMRLKTVLINSRAVPVKYLLLVRSIINARRPSRWLKLHTSELTWGLKRKRRSLWWAPVCMPPARRPWSLSRIRWPLIRSFLPQERVCSESQVPCIPGKSLSLWCRTLVSCLNPRKLRALPI